MKYTSIPWDIIIAKLQNRETDIERNLLEEWLLDERNLKLYQQLYELYYNIQQQAIEYNPDIEYYWKEMQNRMQLSSSVITTKPNDKTKHLWNMKYVAVAAILIGFISILSTYFITRSAIENSSSIVQTYESLSGKSKVILPDGSIVWLNSKSILHYESKFNDTQRRVSLKGEALFDVIKDSNREFIVDIGSVSVHVHGTQFNVEARKGSDEVSVALIRGSVSLETAQSKTYIIPGQKAYYSRKKREIHLEKADTEVETLWASSQIRLENKSLSELRRYFKKWYGVQMVISPEISHDQAYSFTIVNESLEEVLRLMARIHPISFYFGEDDTLFINPL